MSSGGSRVGSGRPIGGTGKRLSAVVRARYGMHHDLPLDVLLASMDYWSMVVANLIENEKADTMLDGVNGEVAKDDKSAKIKEAFQMLGWFAEKAAPYCHAKISSVELGGTLDLRKLGYDDLKTVVTILRKCRVEAPDRIAGPSEDGEEQAVH